MKCPYLTKVIHTPKDITGYSEDITAFCECIKSECPFYYTSEYRPANHIREHCGKAEREEKNG